MNPFVSRLRSAYEARREPRVAAGATGAAVLGVCLLYGGWSLLAGRSDETGPPESGVALATATDRTPALRPVAAAPRSAAPLALEDGTDAAIQPVTNAHLELASDEQVPEIEPAVQQLGFVSDAAPVSTGSPAWLTGGIEADPSNR